MNQNCKDPQEFDLTNRRLAFHKQRWKKRQDYGVLGRKTACSTEIIEVITNQIERNHPLRYTSSVFCLERGWVKSKEIIDQKVYVSPRPPSKISYKDNWMCDLDSDVAGSSKDTQRIQPKPKTQLSSTVRPVCGEESTKEVEKRAMSGQEKRAMSGQEKT